MIRKSRLCSSHDARGAQFEERSCRQLVEHYGDPAAEYRAVTRDVGACDFSEQGKIRAAGRVSSAVPSPLAGKPLALAVLKTEHLEPGTSLEVDWADRTCPARVVQLPLRRDRALDSSEVQDPDISQES